MLQYLGWNSSVCGEHRVSLEEYRLRSRAMSMLYRIVYGLLAIPLQCFTQTYSGILVIPVVITSSSWASLKNTGTNWNQYVPVFFKLARSLRCIFRAFWVRIDIRIDIRKSYFDFANPFKKLWGRPYPGYTDTIFYARCYLSVRLYALLEDNLHFS